MSETRSRPGPIVTVVIVAGSVLLVVLAALIIVLAVTLNSTQRAEPTAEDGSDDEPTTSEIVLDATWANGDALDTDELESAKAVVTRRLDEVEGTAYELEVDGDQLRITFDDDTDDDTIDEAAEALEVAFSADFRQVLDSGFLCTTGQDHTDYGPDENVTFCDQELIQAFDLGPSEVSGQTIIGATIALQNSGEYWGVKIAFNPVGADALAGLSQRLAGAPEGENRIAIVLDGVVLASPIVEEVILNGQVGLSGKFDEAEAEAIATQLRFVSKGLQFSVAD